jgi:hypothetical protein
VANATLALGAEARSKVPGEFLAQRPLVANPPTLLLAVEQLWQLAEQQREQQAVEEVEVEVELEVGSGEENELPKEETSEWEATMLFLRYGVQVVVVVGCVCTCCRWVMLCTTHRDIFPKLKTHFAWYLRTQRAIRGPYQFRWQGTDSAVSGWVGGYEYMRSEESMVFETGKRMFRTTIRGVVW